MKIKSLTILLLLGLLNFSGFGAVIEALSYYNDTETSSENAFNAASLDFSLDSDSDFAPAVDPETDAVRTITVSKDGSLDFEYTVKTAGAVGDLCPSLNLAAELDGTVEY